MLSLPEPGAATLAMLVRCYVHQWPEDYGRPAVPPVCWATEITACQGRGVERIPETANAEGYVSSWCARCQTDHGVGSLLVGPHGEALGG